MDFNKATELFATARNPYNGKPLENNTRLVRVNDDAFAIRFHATNVVTIHRNGTYTLNTGGWYTMSTKQRINSYAPCRLSSKNSLWYVESALGEVPDWRDGNAYNAFWDERRTTPWPLFENGMTVDSNGVPLGWSLADAIKTAEVERIKKQIDKKANLYVKGLTREEVAEVA